MYAHVVSLGVTGLDGYPVTVETHISGGLPKFAMVGLPDSAVKESSERVRSAIKNLNCPWPASHVTVNLAPADVRKTGSLYDLPVFIGILAAQQYIPQPEPHQAFLGELGLDGTLRPIAGALPMALAAQKAGVTELFVPAEKRRRSRRGRAADSLPRSQRCGCDSPPGGAGKAQPRQPHRIRCRRAVAWPRFCGCARPGGGPPRAGSCRCGWAQPVDGGPAGHRQKHAGQAPAGHPAAAQL